MITNEAITVALIILMSAYWIEEAVKAISSKKVIKKQEDFW
jgi:hypothetical protein